MHTKHKGSHSELLACAWLLNCGYEVFRNVSSHGLTDVVAMKDGKFFTFDVKSCNQLVYENTFYDTKNKQSSAPYGQFAKKQEKYFVVSPLLSDEQIAAGITAPFIC